MCGCIDDAMNTWRSEDNFYELILSFYRVGRIEL